MTSIHHASPRFGYAGKWSPAFAPVQQAAYMVKSDPTPVGVEGVQTAPGMGYYRVVTHNEFHQAAQQNRLVWVAG